MFNWSIADMKNMCFHIGIQLFVVWNSKKRPFKRKLIEAPTWLSRSSPRSIWKEEYKVATCAYEKTVCGKFGAPKKISPYPKFGSSYYFSLSSFLRKQKLQKSEHGGRNCDKQLSSLCRQCSEYSWWTSDLVQGTDKIFKSANWDIRSLWQDVCRRP